MKREREKKEERKKEKKKKTYSAREDFRTGATTTFGKKTGIAFR